MNVVTGNPEGGEVLVEGKLRQLVADNEVAEGLLLGKLVAEAEPVVEEAEADDNHAVSVRFCAECGTHGLAEVHGQFVVVVADLFLLTPDGLPGVVDCRAGGAVQYVCEGRRTVLLSLTSQPFMKGWMSLTPPSWRMSNPRRLSSMTFCPLNFRE